jgi:antitoxin component YwqK of YwqJK toxin-antitoxin module
MKRNALFLIVLFLASVFHTVNAQTDTVFNQTDAKNLKQGWWKKNYPDGQMMYKGYFKDNKPVGEMRRYFESGSLMAILQYDSKGEYIHAKMWYDGGQLAAEGWYFNSVKDSTWKYYSYYDQSLTSMETYQKGIRNGAMVHFYKNGEVSEKIEWKNDKKEGPWEQYFNGKILKLKGFYVNGQLNGSFVVNFEDGTPFVSGNYLNDQRHGKWTFYNEDGTVNMVLDYVNGKTADTDKLNDKQEELFRMIDENQGKFEEPDETNFLNPPGR